MTQKHGVHTYQGVVSQGEVKLREMTDEVADEVEVNGGEEPPVEAQDSSEKNCSLYGHKGKVNSVGIYPCRLGEGHDDSDGDTYVLFSASDDSSAKSWDLDSGNALITYHTSEMEGAVEHMVIVGERVLLGGEFDRLRVFNVEFGKNTASYHVRSSDDDIVFIQKVSNKYVLISEKDKEKETGVLKMIEFATGVSRFTLPTGGVATCAETHLGERLVIAGSTNKMVTCFGKPKAAENACRVKSQHETQDVPVTMKWAEYNDENGAARKKLYCLCADGSVLVLLIGLGGEGQVSREEATMHCTIVPRTKLNGKAVGIDVYGNSTVVVSYDTGHLISYTAKGDERMAVKAHSKSISSIHFIPGSEYVFTCGMDGSAAVHNPKSGDEVCRHDLGSPVTAGIPYCKQKKNVAWLFCFGEDGVGRRFLFDIPEGNVTTPRAVGTSTRNSNMGKAPTLSAVEAEEIELNKAAKRIVHDDKMTRNCEMKKCVVQ